MEHASVKAVLVVFLLLLAAALGSSKALQDSKYLGLKLVAKTSLFFLILGALIGPSGFELIGVEDLKQLNPIVVVGLGWIGFLYGSHLEYRDLRKFRASLFWTAFSEALVTFGLVSLALLALSQVTGLQLDPIALVILASTAACTAPTQRYLMSDAKSETYELAHFCSRLDDLPGIVAIGIVFSISPPQVGPNMISSVLFWFVVHIVLGVIFGYITDYLYHALIEGEGETDPGELTLVFFGALSLSSGFAAYLDLSPLFVGVVTGLVFANISDHSDSLSSSLAEREHTVFVLFLLVSGCYWPFRGFDAWSILFTYLVARILGKVLGSFISQKLFLSDNASRAKEAESDFGLALIPQGGLVIAIVVSYLWSFSDSAAGWAVNVVHISVIVNDLIAPYLMRKLDGE